METSYKEKYEQALAKAKEQYNYPCMRSCMGILEEIFPELAENKDEMIRKALKQYFVNSFQNNGVAAICGVHVKDVLAWLEKQGQVKESTISQHENKMCKENDDSLTSENDRIRMEIINYFQCQSEEEPTRKEIHNKWIAWIERQGEKDAITFNNAHIIDPALNDYCCKQYNALHKENGGVLSFARLQHLAMDIYGWCKEYLQCEQKFEMKTAEESLGIDSDTYNKIVDECILGEPKTKENKGNIGGISANSEWSEENEPQKELAESYLAKFDKKFPILPTLKGKRLADYKNFLNKCQQIFGLKYWGVHPRQAKLFEKLSLLWAAWGAEHLQGLGQTYGDMDDEISMWSEEDEENMKKILDAIGSYYYLTTDDDILCNWLKSIKDRVQPQNTWKPSDEQIGLLQAIINEPNNAASESCQIVLREVLEQLKKLKEEV